MLYVYPECLKEERQDLIYHGVAGKSGKEVHLDTARIIVSGGRWDVKEKKDCAS